MFTVFLGQDKSVRRCERRSLSILERLGEAALTSTAGNSACKTPGFSQWTGTTLLKRARKDIFEPFLRPATQPCAGRTVSKPQRGQAGAASCLAAAQPTSAAAARQRELGGQVVFFFFSLLLHEIKARERCPRCTNGIQRQKQHGPSGRRSRSLQQRFEAVKLRAAQGPSGAAASDPPRALRRAVPLRSITNSSMGV